MNFYTDELEHAVRERGRRFDTDSSRELQLEAALASSLDGVRRAFNWINKNVNKRSPGKLFLGTARQAEVKALCEHFTTSSSDAPLPDGCTPVGVALASLFLLKKLPRPLISKKTARKLTTAAQESLLRPDYQEVAIYVAKCAVQELKPSTSGSTVSRGSLAKFNIFLLLKGIIKTLREVAEHENVHGLTSASLAACVGPALTQQTTSTTSGHMGFDICAAIAFLIKNCREVFADASKHSHSNASSHSMHPATAEGTSSQGPDPTMPAHRASKASDRLPSMSNVAWEGRSAPITASQQPQERPQRPASSRGAANQPRKMDNLLTSIAWGPRKTYTAAADEGRCTAGTQQPQRGRSCRNRSRPHASQSPDSGLGRSDTTPGHLHRSSSRGISTSRVFSPGGRKQGGDQEGKPAWKPPGNADRWRWLREKARANSHSRGDDRSNRAVKLMSASSLNSAHPDEQLDENTEDASWTACKGNHSAVCEQGSSGGAKSEASSLNASSSMSDARSVGVTGNGSTLRASGALQQKPTEPDEVSSAAAGQPQVQPASHTPVPADGSRNRRGRNGMSRSVSPGAHGSSEGEHQAGSQTQSFASIRGALQRLQSLGALRSPSSPANPRMPEPHDSNPNSRRWDIRSSSIPTYWPATARHSTPSQAQHNTHCTSPTRVPTAHPVAGLQETYICARNGSGNHGGAAGVSPTAAVFAHHRRAGSAGTPHGTTPPNLAAARQASLQDPLPTLDMTVPQQAQLPDHTSQQSTRAPQPQTAIASNAVLPSPTTTPRRTQRHPSQSNTDANNSIHESPTWGLTESPQRAVVNAQDTSQQGDGIPELQRAVKKRSSPSGASHRARGAAKGPGSGSSGSSSPQRVAAAAAAASGVSATQTPAPESPPLSSTQPVRSVELLTALANQSLSPWLRSPGSSSKHEGAASRQGSTTGGVLHSGAAAGHVSMHGTQGNASGTSGDASGRGTGTGSGSGDGTGHGGSRGSHSQACASIAEDGRDRNPISSVMRHTVSSAQRSRSPTAKASIASGSSSRRSSRRSSVVHSSPDGTVPAPTAPAAARVGNSTRRSRTGEASSGSPERAGHLSRDRYRYAGAGAEHSPSRIPTRSASESPAQSPAGSNSPQGRTGASRSARLQRNELSAPQQHLQQNQTLHGIEGGSVWAVSDGQGAAKKAAMQRFALSDESSTIFSFAPLPGSSGSGGGMNGPFTGLGKTSTSTAGDGVLGPAAAGLSGSHGYAAGTSVSGADGYHAHEEGDARYGSGVHTVIDGDSNSSALVSYPGGAQGGFSASGGGEGGTGARGASQVRKPGRHTAPEVASGAKSQQRSASGRLHSLSDVGATSFNRSGHMGGQNEYKSSQRGSSCGSGTATAAGAAGTAITGFGRGLGSGSGAGSSTAGGANGGTATATAETAFGCGSGNENGTFADHQHDLLHAEASQSGSLCDSHDIVAGLGPETGVHGTGAVEGIGAGAVSGLSVPLVDTNTAGTTVLAGDAAAHGAVAAVFSGNSGDLGLPSEVDLLASFDGPLHGDGRSGDGDMHAGNALEGTRDGREGGFGAGVGYQGYPWGAGDGGALPFAPGGDPGNGTGTGSGTGDFQGNTANTPGQGSGVSTFPTNSRAPRKSASHSATSWKANALADAVAAAARVRNSRVGSTAAAAAASAAAVDGQGQTSVAAGAAATAAAELRSAQAAAAAEAAAAAAAAQAAAAVAAGAPPQGTSATRSSVSASAEHLAALRQLRASQRKGVRASRTFSAVRTSTGGESLHSNISPLESQSNALNASGTSQGPPHAFPGAHGSGYGANGGHGTSSHRLGGSRSRPEFESESPDSSDSGSANSSSHGYQQHRGAKRRKASSSPCDTRRSTSHDTSDTDSSSVAGTPPENSVYTTASCSTSSHETPGRTGSLSPVPEDAPLTHGAAPPTPHTPQIVPAAAAVAAAASAQQLAALSTLATLRPSSPSHGTHVSTSRQDSKASDGEDVSMMLPEGVEIDDLIRLAEIVATPGTKAGGGTPAPTPNTNDANSPSQFMRWMSDMLKAGKAVQGANSQSNASDTLLGGGTAAPAASAPSVPGTCDPTANAKQSAAVLAAALARGLQTPVLGGSQANASVGGTQVFGVTAPPGLQEETSVDTTAKTPQPPKPAPLPPPPPAGTTKPKPKPAEKKKKDDSADEPKPKPAPPSPPPPGKKPGAPPPPPPPPPGKKRPGAPPPPPPPAKPGSRPSNAPPGMRLVRANQLQRQKLKQLHWDAVRNADGMVWSDLAASTELDVDELERLFKLLDNKALKKVQSKAPTQVLLIEGRRAHNVCIELSGIHMDVQSIKEALTTMQTDHITVDALTVLQRSVPTPVECNEIAMYLAGKHPKYKGMSDPQLLGACERYFMHVMNIPNLAERLSCVLFKRNFGASVAQIRHHLGLMASAAQEVRKSTDFKLLLQFVLAVGNFMNSGTAKGAAQGFKIALLLKLEDIKATDRKTTLLQFCIQQAEDKSPSVLNLADDLSVVKQAARLQVTAVETLLTELDNGIKSAQAQVVKACEGQHQNASSCSPPPSDTDGGAAFFTQTMVEFLKGAEEAVAQLRTQSTDTMELLRNLYAYFGERYDGNDPVKILGTLAAFLDLYAKSVKQYRDRRAKEDADAAGTFNPKIQIRPKGGAGIAASTPTAPQAPQPAPHPAAHPPEDLNTPEPVATRQKISVPTTGMRLVPIDPATASAAAGAAPAAPGSAARVPGGGPPPPPPLPGRPFGAAKLPGGAPPPPPPPPRPFGAAFASAAATATVTPAPNVSGTDPPAATAAAPRAAPRPPPPPPPLPPLPLGATPAESTVVVDIHGPGGLPTIPAEAPPQQGGNTADPQQ